MWGIVYVLRAYILFSEVHEFDSKLITYSALSQYMYIWHDTIMKMCSKYPCFFSFEKFAITQTSTSLKKKLSSSNYNFVS